MKFRIRKVTSTLHLIMKGSYFSIEASRSQRQQFTPTAWCPYSSAWKLVQRHLLDCVSEMMAKKYFSHRFANEQADLREKVQLENLLL
jgi:hypothetical protein